MAQKTKSELITEITNIIKDNGGDDPTKTKGIELRSLMQDFLDSLAFLTDVGAYQEIAFSSTLEFAGNFSMTKNQNANISFVLGSSPIANKVGRITINGDSTHTVTFPDTWINANGVAFDNTKRNIINLEYTGTDVIYTVLKTALSVQSLYFRGSGAQDFANFGNNAVLDRTNSFTISAWVKPETAFADGSQIFGKLKTSGNYNGYALHINASGALRFYLQNTVDTNGIQVNTTNTLTLGAWQHVCVTYDGSSNASGIKIYINAVLCTNTVAYNTLSASVADATVNAKSGYGGFGDYKGKISHISIWNIALSLSQIAEIVSTGQPTNLATHSQYSALVNWWKLGAGDSGLSVLDSKGTVTGTLQTGMTFSTDAP